tara:strand:+ start:80 stop:526 length:447 start_codon:yes stop_codon:yes gene_type:complete
MGVEDLIFSQSSAAIDDPLVVDGTNAVITITNGGDDSLTGLGIYISPSTFSGPFTALPDGTPENDYMHVLALGDSGITGGLYIVETSLNGAPTVAVNQYIRSGYGDKMSNKALVIPNLDSSDYVDVSIRVETPASAPARVLYFDFRVE